MHSRYHIYGKMVQKKRSNVFSPKGLCRYCLYKAMKVSKHKQMCQTSAVISWHEVPMTFWDIVTNFSY